MSLQMIHRPDRSELPAPGPVDGLTADQFDRAFMFFNIFVDDPRTCLDLAESVFRSLQNGGADGEQAFYGRLVEGVRALPARNELVRGVGADSVLCWLLKDSADLSYAQIGAVMALERSQVRARIAEVRMALLG